MNKKTKHFVTFYYPGAFVAEDSTMEIDYRFLGDVLGLKNAKGAYGFTFHSIDYINFDGKEYKSEIFDKTGMFYIDGEIFTFKQMKKRFPEEHISISNMEVNRWEKIVRTNAGWFLPFRKNDQIINR